MRKGDGVRKTWKWEGGEEWEETGKDKEEERKEQEVRGGPIRSKHRRQISG